MNGQRVAIAAPVGKTGSMTQHEASSNLSEAWIVVDVRLREIGGQRNVKADLALFHKLQNGVCEDRLAERGSFEDGVVVYRLSGRYVFHAEIAVPRNFAVADYDDRHAGNICHFHQHRNISLHFCYGGSEP